MSTRELGPNWYSAVMGTAIVAGGGAALPVSPPGLLAVWALAAAMLVALLALRAVHWVRHTDRALADLGEPTVAPFYGCLSMALLAVGGAALAVEAPGAVAVDLALWTAGTVVGLAVAVAIPYLMVTRHHIAPEAASPVLLLPLVAPMVSAALGPALLPHLPDGQVRLAMSLGCLAMFGISVFATLVVLPAVFSCLLHHGAPALALTPTLFLVLGPLGQSTTALGNLADLSTVQFGMAAVLYGVPVIGFALLWFAFALSMVVRAARLGMRFSMTWWAFTFPVGTCVTGAASLARHTGLDALDWLATGLYAFLVVAVGAALTGTVRGVLRRQLLAAPA